MTTGGREERWDPNTRKRLEEMLNQPINNHPERSRCWLEGIQSASEGKGIIHCPYDLPDLSFIGVPALSHLRRQLPGSPEGIRATSWCAGLLRTYGKERHGIITGLEAASAWTETSWILATASAIGAERIELPSQEACQESARLLHDHLGRMLLGTEPWMNEPLEWRRKARSNYPGHSLYAISLELGAGYMLARKTTDQPISH